MFHSYLRISVCQLFFLPKTLKYGLTAAQDISAVSIDGLSFSSYVDKTLDARTEPASNSPLTITSETDRVYTLPSSQPITILEASKPRFEVARDELPDVVVWNPWEGKAGGMADFGPDGAWKNMICVEAGSVSGWNTLEAGDTWEGGQRLKAM